MSETRTFSLENQTKFGLVIGHSDFIWLVWFKIFTKLDHFMYFYDPKKPKQPCEPNKSNVYVQNQNNLTTEPKRKAPKSKRSDFRHSLKQEKQSDTK